MEHFWQQSNLDFKIMLIVISFEFVFQMILIWIVQCRYKIKLTKTIRFIMYYFQLIIVLCTLAYIYGAIIFFSGMQAQWQVFINVLELADKIKFIL